MTEIEIEVLGLRLTGTLRDGQGYFSNHDNGATYYGQSQAGKAHGLGVFTFRSIDARQRERSGGWSMGFEHGYNVECTVPCIFAADRKVTSFFKEYGKTRHYAEVKFDGRCEYDQRRCSADDPLLCELKAAAQDVSVLRAALVPSMPHTTIYRRPCSAYHMT
jgi:hypothetical protein